MVLFLSNANLQAQTTKTWNGGATGDWDDNSAWLPIGMPNSTNHVEITDAIVTVDINTAACINLTLNGTAQINFAGTNDLLSVYGEFDNQASSNPVTGTGLLQFSGSSNADIDGNSMTLNRVRINKTSAEVHIETDIDITESLVLNNTSQLFINTSAGKNLTMKATFNSGTGDWNTAYIHNNGSGTVVNRVTLEQAFAENYKCYHILCSPVEDTYAYTVTHEPYTATTDVYNTSYCFDEVSSIPDWMIYHEDDAGPNYPSAACSMYGWCGIDNSTQILRTQGYLGNFEPDGNQVIAWYGVPNNGDIGDGDITSIPLQYTNNSQPDLDGINVLGNPYPEPLDLQELWDENDAITGFTPIFWVYQNTGAGYGTQVLFFDASGMSSSTLPSQYMAIGQGFEVQTTVDDIEIQFKSSMRVANNNVEVIRRQPLQNQIQLLLSGLNNPDYFSVSLNDAFDNTHFVGEDVYKRMNEKNNFYATYDKHHLAADKLKFPDTEHIVPINLIINEHGEYTINTSLFTIDNDKYVSWMEDKTNKTNYEVNQDYSKTYFFEKGEVQNRFYLHIANRAQIGNASVANTGFYTYYDNGYININLPAEFKDGQIKIHTLNGTQSLEPVQTYNQNRLKIPAQNLSQGLYFISAANETQELQTKLIISK
jgi:hypothetical protein